METAGGQPPPSPSAPGRPVRLIDVRLIETTKKRIEFSLIISLVSLLLSAGAALAAFSAWWRGPEIEVAQPQMTYLYRDGPADAGVLKVGVHLTIVNAAEAQYGDALMNAQVRLVSSGPEWAEEAVGRVSILSETPKETPACSIGFHCINQGGFHSQEEDFQAVSIPGGAVQSLNH